MHDTAIEHLATRLRRPPSSLAPLRRLSPEQLQELQGLVERTLAAQSRQLQADLRHALPWPLRWLLRVQP